MKQIKHKCLGGSICGGVISKSEFDSDPWAYMMQYYMPDIQFKKYKEICASGDEKRRKQFFEQYARSPID